MFILVLTWNNRWKSEKCGMEMCDNIWIKFVWRTLKRHYITPSKCICVKSFSRCRYFISVHLNIQKIICLNLKTKIMSTKSFLIFIRTNSNFFLAFSKFWYIGVYKYLSCEYKKITPNQIVCSFPPLFLFCVVFQWTM